MYGAHFLNAWLAGSRISFPSISFDASNEITSGWLNLDSCFDLDEAADQYLPSLQLTRRACDQYLAEACGIIGAKHYPNVLSESERDLISSRLGAPPQNSYSIYIMSAGEGEAEKAVYVGQNNAKTQRFEKGHAAISKLHNRKFDQLRKQIYFGCITIVDEDENSFPLDWLPDDKIQDAILTSVEHQLIFKLQPELNDIGKQKLLAQMPISLQVQNMCASRFLDCQTL